MNGYAQVTTMAAVKRALVARMRERPGLSGVHVVYGDGDGRRRESIRLGPTSEGDVEAVAFAGPGRRRREETYEVEVIVEVIGKRTPEDNEDRAVALAGEVMDLVAGNPKLAGPQDEGVPGVAWVIASASSLDTTETTDGPRSVLTLTLTVKARLA